MFDADAIAARIRDLVDLVEEDDAELLDAQQRALQSAEESLRLTRTTFRYGNVGILQVLDAQRQAEPEHDVACPVGGQPDQRRHRRRDRCAVRDGEHDEGRQLGVRIGRRVLRDDAVDRLPAGHRLGLHLEAGRLGDRGRLRHVAT
ncbi:MAG: hypothetical protein ABR585_15265, partial [Gemmatimonadaceae bacterium]